MTGMVESNARNGWKWERGLESECPTAAGGTSFFQREREAFTERKTEISGGVVVVVVDETRVRGSASAKALEGCLF